MGEIALNHQQELRVDRFEDKIARKVGRLEGRLQNGSLNETSVEKHLRRIVWSLLRVPNQHGNLAVWDEGLLQRLEAFVQRETVRAMELKVADDVRATVATEPDAEAVQALLKKNKYQALGEDLFYGRALVLHWNTHRRLIEVLLLKNCPEVDKYPDTVEHPGGKVGDTEEALAELYEFKPEGKKFMAAVEAQTKTEIKEETQFKHGMRGDEIVPLPEAPFIPLGSWSQPDPAAAKFKFFPSGRNKVVYLGACRVPHRINGKLPRVVTNQDIDGHCGSGRIRLEDVFRPQDTKKLGMNLAPNSTINRINGIQEAVIEAVHKLFPEHKDAFAAQQDRFLKVNPWV